MRSDGAGSAESQHTHARRPQHRGHTEYSTQPTAHSPLGWALVSLCGVVVGSSRRSAATSLFLFLLSLFCLPILSGGVQFSSVGGDISFSIEGEGGESILAPERVQADKAGVAGSLTVPSTGLLVLVWDNSFSWFNAKQIKYTVKLDTTQCVTVTS